MLICNCNGISERQVKAAACSGAACWNEVHAYYDFTPCCGKCECEIADAIADHLKTSHHEPNSFIDSKALAVAT